MKVGAERIRAIVLALRSFSRMDEADLKAVDLQDGIESTLMILQHRLKETSEHLEIQVIRQYGNLPAIECYAGQLNQVFMNILSNAIDALEESGRREKPAVAGEMPTIEITTQVRGQWAEIQIRDNAGGIPEAIRRRIFEPFFTTKSIGKGTGLGLSISYQVVVDKHSGQLTCRSTPPQGTEFAILLPWNRAKRR